MIILFASGDGGPVTPPASTGSGMMTMGLGRGWVLPFLLVMKELFRYG